MWGLFLKRGSYLFLYYFYTVLSFLCVRCAGVCFTYLHHFYQWLFFVSWEELSLIESNQQICDCTSE